MAKKNVKSEATNQTALERMQKGSLAQDGNAGALAPAGRNYALFAPVQDEEDDEAFKRANLPQMLKPSEWPVGVIVQGVFRRVVQSPSEKQRADKAYLLHMEIPLQGGGAEEVLIPLSGTIRKALCPNLPQKPELEEAERALSKLVGHKIRFKKLPDGTSKNYGNKKMFMFDVFTSVDPATGEPYKKQVDSGRKSK